MFTYVFLLYANTPRPVLITCTWRKGTKNASQSLNDEERIHIRTLKRTYIHVYIYTYSYAYILTYVQIYFYEQTYGVRNTQTYYDESKQMTIVKRELKCSKKPRFFLSHFSRDSFLDIDFLVFQTHHIRCQGEEWLWETYNRSYSGWDAFLALNPRILLPWIHDSIYVFSNGQIHEPLTQYLLNNIQLFQTVISYYRSHRPLPLKNPERRRAEKGGESAPRHHQERYWKKRK